MLSKDSAEAESPIVSSLWKRLSAEERMQWLTEVTTSNPEFTILSPISCSDDGRVIVTFKTILEPEKRGWLLRYYERVLKESIDAGLTVWCEATGDKNPLRKLRVVKVLSD